MSLLFRQSFIGAGLLNGLTDIHSHILCGVDDGVKTMDETLDVLAYYEEHGVSRVFFTPHIMEDYPANTPAFLRQRFKEVESAYKGGMQLLLAAEYMLDPSFGKHLDAGLLTLSGNKVLLESYSSNDLSDFESMLYKVQTSGYDIILAHPERYMNFSMEKCRVLKQRRVFLQMNMLSIFGSYGKEVKAISKELLRAGMYDYIGSDMHRLRWTRNSLDSKELRRKDVEQIKILIEKNKTI